MDTVLERIKQQMGYLTPNETKLAEYILSHPAVVMDGSINVVAKRVGISVASVSRMSKTLGFKTWKDLRLSLAKDTIPGVVPMSKPRGAGSQEDAVVDSVFHMAILGIQKTLQSIDRAALKTVVELVKQSTRIVFFGTGGSGYLAMNEAFRFSHLRSISQASTESWQMILQGTKMTAGEIAFGFSNSGRSVATVRVLAEARKAGAITVGISNFPNTPLEKVSNYFFRTACANAGDPGSALTARTGLQAIMDAIYVLSAQRGAARADMEHFPDAMLDTSLREPPRSHQATRIIGKMRQ